MTKQKKKKSIIGKSNIGEPKMNIPPIKSPKELDNMVKKGF